MNRNQRLHELHYEGLVTADVSCQTKVMEWHEDAVGADEGEPEMNLAQSFVHHAPVHLGEPEVSAGKDAKHRGHAHHHVEVSNHEIGGVQHDVERGLSQEESTDAAGDEH